LLVWSWQCRFRLLVPLLLFFSFLCPVLSDPVAFSTPLANPGSRCWNSPFCSPLQAAPPCVYKGSAQGMLLMPLWLLIGSKQIPCAMPTAPIPARPHQMSSNPAWLMIHDPRATRSLAAVVNQYLCYPTCRQALLRAHRLDEDNELYRTVDDFGWIKAVHSPNWSVIPEQVARPASALLRPCSLHAWAAALAAWAGLRTSCLTAAFPFMIACTFAALLPSAVFHGTWLLRTIYHASWWLALKVSKWHFYMGWGLHWIMAIRKQKWLWATPGRCRVWLYLKAASLFGDFHKSLKLHKADRPLLPYYCRIRFFRGADLYNLFCRHWCNVT